VLLNLAKTASADVIVDETGMARAAQPVSQSLEQVNNRKTHTKTPSLAHESISQVLVL
jgi:hypothetical protein